MTPKIIHTEPEFLVIYKPSGMVVHPARINGALRRSGEETLTDWLVSRYPELRQVGDDPEERPGIVHRLDKDTSGLMIIPRTQAAFEYFKKQFQEHKIDKTYWALVWGVPQPERGEISKSIGIKDGTTRRTVHGGKMVKEAVTDYETIQAIKLSKGDATLVAVKPKTGRTHQIRVHMASIKCPILGDTMYGRKKDGSPRLMLHAYALQFVSPQGRALRIEHPPEDDFTSVAQDHLSTV